MAVQISCLNLIFEKSKFFRTGNIDQGGRSPGRGFWVLGPEIYMAVGGAGDIADGVAGQGTTVSSWLTVDVGGHPGMAGLGLITGPGGQS